MKRKEISQPEAWRGGFWDPSEWTLLPEEQMALFRPGDIVEPRSGFKLLELHHHVNSTGRKPAGWPDRAQSNPRFKHSSDWSVDGSKPKLWLVLNVRWEPDACHLWIEIMSFDGTLRGWLVEPFRHVRIAAAM